MGVMSWGADVRSADGCCGCGDDEAWAEPVPAPRRRLRRGRDCSTVSEFKLSEGLPRPEGDDAADRIVGGDANRHAIAWHHLDSEAAHPAAQLRKHFVPRIALNAIQPTGVDRHHRSLHVYEIVFAQ